jgi:hypothetical protein
MFAGSPYPLLIVRTVFWMVRKQITYHCFLIPVMVMVILHLEQHLLLNNCMSVANPIQLPRERLSLLMRL